ncbi:hypothetical protein M3Y97_00077800 [Aphelenchoides bicaudatus]|nr:hypothetical protein M3Y97_00077800 [Aphelenchoides bicaudatus]
MESLRRSNNYRWVNSEPCSPPPSPISFSESLPQHQQRFSLFEAPCRCSLSRERLSSMYPENMLIHQRIRSIPMLNKASSLNRLLLESGSPSRGAESTLELEALAAVHQLSFAVQTIMVSEMLPRTSELIFLNVTTLEGQPYCIELTHKGWRVTSLRSDCMQGDFTRIELFTMYHDSLCSLLEVISPDYKNRFSEKLTQRLRLLETAEENGVIIAPPSSFISSPVLDRHFNNMSNSASTDSSLAD